MSAPPRGKLASAWGAPVEAAFGRPFRWRDAASMFYSYFSTTMNLVAERTGTTDFRNPAAVAGWLGDMMLLLVVPALGPALVLALLRGDDEDDLPKQLAQAQGGYLLGMLVGARELAGPTSGFDYTGPPVGRIVTDIGRLGTQVGQGELDEPAVLALIRLVGTTFGLPVTQGIRSYRGIEAFVDGKAPFTSIFFGPPQH